MRADTLAMPAHMLMLPPHTANARVRAHDWLWRIAKLPVDKLVPVQAIGCQAAAHSSRWRRCKNILCHWYENAHCIPMHANCDGSGMPAHPRRRCRAAPRGLTYADLGGIDGVLDDIMELIVCPLKHPEVRS